MAICILFETPSVSNNPLSHREIKIEPHGTSKLQSQVHERPPSAAAREDTFVLRAHVRDFSVGCLRTFAAMSSPKMSNGNLTSRKLETVQLIPAPHFGSLSARGEVKPNKKPLVVGGFYVYIPIQCHLLLAGS